MAFDEIQRTLPQVVPEYRPMMLARQSTSHTRNRICQRSLTCRRPHSSILKRLVLAVTAPVADGRGTLILDLLAGAPGLVAQ